MAALFSPVHLIFLEHVRNVSLSAGWGSNMGKSTHLLILRAHFELLFFHPIHFEVLHERVCVLDVSRTQVNKRVSHPTSAHALKLNLLLVASLPSLSQLHPNPGTHVKRLQTQGSMSKTSFPRDSNTRPADQGRFLQPMNHPRESGGGYRL